MTVWTFQEGGLLIGNFLPLGKAESIAESGRSPKIAAFDLVCNFLLVNEARRLNKGVLGWHNNQNEVRQDLSPGSVRLGMVE